jgi:hypothetical protein
MRFRWIPTFQLYNGGQVGKDASVVHRHPRDPPNGNRPPTPLENRRLRFQDASQYDLDDRARYGQRTAARCGRFGTMRQIHDGWRWIGVLPPMVQLRLLGWFSLSAPLATSEVL